MGLNLETLVTGDGGTKGVVSQVTGDTDTGGINHLVLISGEVGAIKLSGVHGADMLIVGAVTVVGLNDLVHEGSEIVEGFVGATINTDTGVGPLAAREDSLSKSVAILVFSVLALLPDFLGEGLREEGGGTSGEEGEVLNILGGIEMGTHHGSSDISVGNL